PSSLSEISSVSLRCSASIPHWWQDRFNFVLVGMTCSGHTLSRFAIAFFRAPLWMAGAMSPRSAFVEEQSVNRNEQLQALIQLYKSETGVKAFDCDAIAEWAMRRGATMPKPKTPRELF